MKSSEIKITTELNERLCNRGITKPPRKITVKMVKDEDGLITISLPKAEKETDLLKAKEGQPALPEMKEKALPEEKQEALPAAAEETLAPAPAKTKAPAKKKTPAKTAKKPAAKKKAGAKK